MEDQEIMTVLFCDVSAFIIDHFHNGANFKYSFVNIQISPTNLILELKFQKNVLPKTRLVGPAYLNVHQRIFKICTIMKVVYMFKSWIVSKIIILTITAILQK